MNWLGTMVVLIWATIIFKKKGIQPCFSDTYYNAEHPIMFSFVCVLYVFCTLPKMIELSTGLEYHAAVIAATGLLLVSASPHYRSNRDGEIFFHASGALLAMVGAFVWVFNVMPIALLSWIFFIILLCIDKKRVTLYLELATFFTVEFTTKLNSVVL